MRRLGKHALTIVAFLATLVIPASAQTASPISLQVSGLWSIPFSGGLSGVSAGPGVEAQIRYNPGLFSIGVGGEISWHDVTGTNRSVRLTGAFIEPRYVIQTGSESVAPYISGRVAVSQTTFEVSNLTSTGTGFTANGGGGLLIVLGASVNLDLGATIGAKGLGSATVPTTPPTVFDLGSGNNVIIRVGLAIGL